MNHLHLIYTFIFLFELITIYFCFLYHLWLLSKSLILSFSIEIGPKISTNAFNAYFYKLVKLVCVLY